MNSYHEIDTIKMEKQKAMQRYMIFKKIGNIARTLEIVVAITLISYSISFTSSYFPAFVDVSGAILRRISSLLFSPHFVFLVGNIIIITLFAKSSAEKSVSDNSGDEISKFVAGDSGDEISAEKASSDNVGDEIPAEKALSENAVEEIRDDLAKSTVERESEMEAKSTVEREPEVKVYRRTKSTMEVVVAKKELRRSTTEYPRKIKGNEKSPSKERKKVNRKAEEDELSNEEFRRKVEEFIAKQQRSLREEKLAVIVSKIK